MTALQHSMAYWLLKDLAEALEERLTHDELGLIDVWREFHRRNSTLVPQNGTPSAEK